MTDEIVGQRFGKLVVERFDHFYIKPSDGKREKRWFCKCDCGGSTVTAKRKLQTGWTESCGCIQRTRKGITKSEEFHPTYSVWNMIIQRCTNPNFRKGSSKVDYYIGYVDVDARWTSDNGFENFLEDMGKRPSLKHSIDRVDPSAGYCKDNCRWTDDNSLQAFNQLRKKNNTSGKTGVVFDDKRSKPWIAQISRFNKTMKKYFRTFDEAATQRDVWEKELYGFNKNDSVRLKNDDRE